MQQKIPLEDPSLWHLGKRKQKSWHMKEVNKSDTIKISLLFNYKNTKYFTLPLSSLHSTNLKTQIISVFWSLSAQATQKVKL